MTEACAPSILITFIDMVLFKNSKAPGKDCNIYMFAGQSFFQTIFVLIALACIPVMLLGKPIKIMQARKLANVSTHSAAFDLCQVLRVIVANPSPFHPHHIIDYFKSGSIRIH